jgi:hypothetical protein
MKFKNSRNYVIELLRKVAWGFCLGLKPVLWFLSNQIAMSGAIFRHSGDVRVL